MACVNANENDVRYWCQKWCPYQVGDHLWVRETWAPYDELVLGYALDSPEWVVFRADGKMWNTHTHCYADKGDLIDPARWRPSIHMPRWASRITLEITGVRMERVQNILERDAEAEGVHPTPEFWPDPHRHAFELLWDSIYAKRGLGWDVNPWVWALEFRA